MAGLVLHGRLGKFTWRMLATVLVGESICLFFGALVARALAATGPDTGRSGTYLVVGSALAVLAIVAAGMLRRPIGVSLGWLVQVLTIASAVVLPMMLIVGVLFLVLWITCLLQGARIDRIQAAYATQAGLDGDGHVPGDDDQDATHGDQAPTDGDQAPTDGDQAPTDGDQGADRVTG